MEGIQGRPVRVGVIGVGIGRLHLQSLSKIPNDQVEVAALCDADQSRAERNANEFGIANIFTDHKEMLKQDYVDAALVCTPNYLHAAMTLDAFAAGKHVFCEKPMAMNAVEAEKMVEAGEKAGKMLMMGFNNRFRGDSQLLKKFIENGELGNIYYAKTGWIRRKGIPGCGGWFTTKSKAGGGPLIDIGVHVLDLTLWLMGNPRPTSVMGSAYTVFGPKAAAACGGTYDVEDLAVGLIKLDNGATLFLEASWASHIAQDVIYTNLVGTEGGADLDPLRIYKDIQGVSVDLTPQFGQLSGHEMAIKHFVECLREGKEPMSTGRHGLDIMRILDSIYKSMDTGHGVTL
ncbi:MAG: Gfo/Idh/MocA family oxidoreductase [Armatimonadota bacterium]|nr:Gfo/Idh/MocA family oxidoreductase [Armatimonadota bacterium]